MPDMTTHTTYTCDSNKEWSTRVTSECGRATYTVRFGSTFGTRSRYQYDWSCSCKGFKFRGTCKHLDQVKHLRCGWNEAMDPCVEPAPGTDGKHACPECGGSVSVVQIAV